MKTAIPAMGTPKMQITSRSSVIGGIPRPEARSTSGEEPPVRSSVKPSHDNLKDELIGRTREVWQPRLGRDLGPEDARQIAANVTGFFSVLAKWSRAELPSPANYPGKADASKNGEGCHGR